MVRSVKRLGPYIWPDTASFLAKVITLAEVLIAAVAITAGVAGLLGWLPVQSERAAQAVLALGGLVALAFTLETVERRRVMAGLEDWSRTLEHLRGEALLREVPSEKIREEISTMLAGSTEWLFRGGSARFLRTTTLPTLAGRKTLDVSVFIALLDPRDLDLCAGYASYRHKIGRNDPVVNARSIQAEILATIYLAGWYASGTRLRPTIVLLRSFSQLRYDIAPTGLLVTVADLSKPALYASSESWYYRSLRDELEQSVHGNPTLQLPDTAAVHCYPPSLEDVRASHVRDALLGTTASEAPLLVGPADTNQIDWELVTEGALNPY